MIGARASRRRSTRALIPHGEPADRPLVAAHDRHDRRAVEPRAVPLALRGGRRRRAARSSTARAGPRSARASCRRRRRSRSRRARSAGRRSGWRWTSSTRTGNSVRGEVGELVCRKPFPGMTRGFWRDPERYLDTYWRRFPGIWTHGDWASVDEDGYWFLHGRSDDTLNIAGKRIGPAELESAAVGHPAVAEAAAIGVPHEVKGEVAWIFCVADAGHEADDALAAEVAAAVAGDLGKAFKPDRVSSCRRCRRRAARRSSAARCARRRSAPTRATSRRSRTPSRWRRSQMPSESLEQRSSPAADAESARASPASSRRTAGRSSSRRGAATRSRRSRTRSAAARSSSTSPTARRSSAPCAETGDVELLVANAGSRRPGRRDLGDRSRATGGTCRRSTSSASTSAAER